MPNKKLKNIPELLNSNSEKIGKFVDRSTRPHKFIPNRAGQCAGCIFPKDHPIHLANLQ